MKVLERIFTTDPTFLLPEITPDNAPFWDGLSIGEYRLQRCSGCSRARAPIAPVCPSCRSLEFDWMAACGRGTVFSWVRFKKSYLPQFEDLMPYTVLTVQLNEGVRVYGRLADRDAPVSIGMPVSIALEQWPGERLVPLFVVGD